MSLTCDPRKWQISLERLSGQQMGASESPSKEFPITMALRNCRNREKTPPAPRRDEGPFPLISYDIMSFILQVRSWFNFFPRQGCNRGLPDIMCQFSLLLDSQMPLSLLISSCSLAICSRSLLSRTHLCPLQLPPLLLLSQAPEGLPDMLVLFVWMFV